MVKAILFAAALLQLGIALSVGPEALLISIIWAGPFGPKAQILVALAHII